MPRESRVYCAIEPASQWGWQEVLLNKTNFLLEVIAWQNTKDGRKKHPINKPKLWMPDFMKSAYKTKDQKEVGSYTTAEIDALLALPRH